MSAKQLRQGTDIVFADDKERTIYPLTIRQLRKFMKIIKDLNTKDVDEQSMSDEDIDSMVEAASIVLEKVDPKLSADKEAIEDALDIKIFNQVVAAAMGADPNV